MVIENGCSVKLAKAVSLVGRAVEFILPASGCDSRRPGSPHPVDLKARCLALRLEARKALQTPWFAREGSIAF